MVAPKRRDDSQVMKTTFAKWLEEAAGQSDAAFESMHVDELEGLGFADVDGLELVRRACVLLEHGRTILRGVHGARAFPAAIRTRLLGR
jgi:hypothetical protein